MRVGFPADDTIRESMPEKEGYFEQRSVNGGKSTAFVLKVPNSLSGGFFPERVFWQNTIR